MVKVDVNGWLEAFAAHPQIGESPSPSSHTTSAQSLSLPFSSFNYINTNNY